MKPDKPSATARIVAMNIAAMAARPESSRLVSPEARALTARMLASGGALSRRLPALLEKPWFQGLFDAYESLAVPGMALHQALRKRRIEDAVTRDLEDGAGQMVVLGGGFDTLAARLARRFPSSAFLETDHPATQAVKRAALAEAGYLSPNLSLQSLDFNRHSLREALPALPGFRPEAPAVCVCEGVLMYLDAEAVDRLFADLASLPCPRLRFAFTFMEPDARGNIAFRGSSPLVAAWLRLRGESFTWGLRAEELEGFLAARGFALEEIADAASMESRYLSGYPAGRIAEGEKVAVASAQRG